jgi:hypothetical protein
VDDGLGTGVLVEVTVGVAVRVGVAVGVCVCVGVTTFSESLSSADPHELSTRSVITAFPATDGRV